MKEVTYRSIFPGNNIPKVTIHYKEPSIEENLIIAVNSLMYYADFSKISGIVKELEFNELVKQDPANALLQKLAELSGKDEA